jgi:hypothetical protein
MADTGPRPTLRLRLLKTGVGLLQIAHHGLMVAQLRLRHKLTFEQHFRCLPDDVFICTSLKSGTTLMQMIVHQLRGDGGMDIPHINAVVPWLEAEVLGENFGLLESVPRPRVFKTHLLWKFLPRGARCIYIVRDVRDVFVSGYHHQCLMMGQRMAPEVYARHFQQPRAHSGTWFDHLQSWWPHRNDPNVLFLTYEGMIADLEGTVRRVAAFTGLPLDESQLPRILERCSIEFMRRHEEKFDPRVHQTEALDEHFIRKGKAGLWREELPAAERERLEERVRRLARKLGGREEDPFDYLLEGGRAGAGRPPAAAGTAGRLAASGPGE